MKLKTRIKYKAGRNNKGHITSYHKGKKHKQLYRIIDYKRIINNIEGIILDKEYDPYRNCYINLICYKNGIISYILNIKTIEILNIIESSTIKNIISKIGNSLLLKYIPIGYKINNIELYPGNGGKIIRSGGLYGIIINQLENKTLIKLPSGNLRYFNNKNMATIGEISTLPLKIKYKAGQNRWLGKKPIVRGIAMNPIDHPHGGGGGKKKGIISSTPWGKPTKGYKTRNKRKKNYCI
jgi:large subunit ribosomal protein L2